MALAPYTTPALVRSALGVSIKERSDAEIDTRTNQTWMLEQLYEISDTLPAHLAVVFATASTTAEQRLRDLGELYCSTQVALKETTAAPLFAPKEIKDDRTALTRIDDPFKRLRDELVGTLGYLRNRLVKAYLVAYPSATINEPTGVDLATSVGLVSSPSIDPVTAES